MEGFEREGSAWKDVINSIHDPDLSIIMVGHMSPYKVKKELTFFLYYLLQVLAAQTAKINTKRLSTES